MISFGLFIGLWNALLAYAMPPSNGHPSDPGGLAVVHTGRIGYGRRRMTTLEAPRTAGRTRFSWRTAWPWFAAALSGGLATLCLAPWNQDWLCWLALTPLLAAVWATADGTAPAAGAAAGRFARMWRTRWMRGFALGYVAGLVFFWCAFYWLRQVTGIGWFILPFYMGMYFAVWGSFMATVAKPWTGKTTVVPGGGVSAARSVFHAPEPASGSALLRSRWNLWFAFLGASAWVGLEWVRGWMFSGFGWNDLGVGLHAIVPFLQIVEWTGVGGASFLAAFVNVIAVATVGRFALEVRSHRVRPHFDFTLTIAGLLLVFSYGIRAVRTSERAAAQPGASVTLKVAAVQANIVQGDKWNPAMEGAIRQTYTELSEAAMATRPQLLLWPEAATPYGLFDGHRTEGQSNTFEFVTGLARRFGCNFLLGTLDYDFGPDGHAQADYNAAMMLATGAERFQVYRKIHLVPYGEYVPFRHSFPLFAWIIGDQVPGDFAHGTEPGVFMTNEPSLRLGPLICFEDTIGRVAREPVRRGAQLLVNITNDGWFGTTAANQQQLAESVFRAAENRRPLVRCANTGVTAFIDRDGRVTQILRMPGSGSVFGQGILTGDVQVPTDGALTFYTRHGEVFSAACAAAAGLLAFLRVWRTLRGRELRRRRERLAAPTTTGALETVP